MPPSYSCATPSALLHGVVVTVRGDIAWLLLIGYVVDLQLLLTPLLTGMVLL